jgi:hypothetical protein
VEAFVTYACPVITFAFAFITLLKDASGYGDMSKRFGKHVVRFCVVLVVLTFCGSLYSVYAARKEAHAEQCRAESDRTQSAKDRSDARVAADKSEATIGELRRTIDSSEKTYLMQVAKLCPTPKTPKQTIIALAEHYRDGIDIFLEDTKHSLPIMSDAERRDTELQYQFERRLFRHEAESMNFYRSSPYYVECLSLATEFRKYKIDILCSADSTHVLHALADSFVERAKKL